MKITGWLVAAGLGVAIGAELFVALRPPLAPVPAEDLAQAAAFVVDHAEAGEPVVHSPLFAPEILPALGSLAARPDLPPPALRRRRIWIIDRAGVEMYVSDTQARETQARFGDVHVWTAEPSAAADAEGGPLFDLRRDLAPGMMRVEREGQVVSRCGRTRSAGGYACPGQPEWIYAAPHQQVIGGVERACVWAHPITDASVVFELPAQPDPGEARLRLTVGAGLSDVAVATPDGRPVRTVIRAPGRAPRTLTVPNRRGWYEETLEISPGAPVELEITTPFDGVRHHCIEATISVQEPAEGHDEPAAPKEAAP